MVLTKTQNGVEVPLSDEEIAEFEERERIHRELMESLKKVQYKEDRRKEYPPIDDIVEALIENQEGDPAALNKVKALRAQVKAKYPKNG